MFGVVVVEGLGRHVQGEGVLGKGQGRQLVFHGDSPLIGMGDEKADVGGKKSWGAGRRGNLRPGRLRPRQKRRQGGRRVQGAGIFDGGCPRNPMARRSRGLSNGVGIELVQTVGKRIKFPHPSRKMPRRPAAAGDNCWPDGRPAFSRAGRGGRRPAELQWRPAGADARRLRGWRSVGRWPAARQASRFRRSAGPEWNQARQSQPVEGERGLGKVALGTAPEAVAFRWRFA